MGKHKVIILDEKEIEEMLQGRLHWSDVAHRLERPIRRTGIRQLTEPLPSRTSPRFPGYDKEDLFPLKQDTQNHQDLKYQELKQELNTQKEYTSYDEKPQDEKAQYEKPPCAKAHNREWDKRKEELMDEFFSEDFMKGESEKESAPFEGKKVMVLLGMVGIITVVLWFYYLLV